MNRNDFVALGTAAALGVTSRPLRASAQQRGGTLSFVRQIDVLDWDPYNWAQGNHAILEQLFDAPTTYNERVEPQPALAEAWTFSRDKKRMSLKIRKGVTFHSGRAVTAADIIYTLQRTQNPSLGKNMTPAASRVARAEAPDVQTVILEFDQPYAPVFDLLAELFILDKDTVATIKQTTIGTGPFMRKSWSPGDGFVLTRNTNYWRNGRPILDTVDARIVPDPDAMVASLQSGQSQIADTPPLSLIPSLRSQGVEIAGGSFARALSLLLNVKQPPFDNVKVRQAMNWAINRERISRVVLSGLGSPATLPWAPNSLAFDPALSKTVGFDLDRAKALLREAGFPSGIEATLSVSEMIEPERLAAAEIITADLAKIGCKIKIDNISALLYRDRFTHGTFQMASHGFGNIAADPNGIVLTYHYKPAGATNYDSPRYRKLLDQGAEEFNPAKRKAIYHELGQLLLQESFCCMIAHRKSPFLLRPSVRGFATTLDANPEFADVWLTK